MTTTLHTVNATSELHLLVQERRRHEARLREAMHATRYWTLILLGEGVSECEAARLAGVTRSTVRKWAGK